jgi:hypothetical protein
MVDTRRLIMLCDVKDVMDCIGQALRQGRQVKLRQRCRERLQRVEMVPQACHSRVARLRGFTPRQADVSCLVITMKSSNSIVRSLLIRRSLLLLQPRTRELTPETSLPNLPFLKTLASAIHHPVQYT